MRETRDKEYSDRSSDLIFYYFHLIVFFNKTILKLEFVGRLFEIARLQ